MSSVEEVLRNGSLSEFSWFGKREPSHALDLCERAALDTPEHPSIYYFDSEISHLEASSAAHALAGALRREFGVSSGASVALMMQNIPQMVIALHAVWLLGAVVTPVNVMSKPPELIHQLNDSGAMAIICHESFYESVRSVLAATKVKYLITVSELDYLDAIPNVLSTSQRWECPTAVRYSDLIDAYRDSVCSPKSRDPSSPALLTYTSGTTGIPKGAINTHGAVAYSAGVWRRWYDLGPSDVVVAVAPLFHITGLMGHFAASRAALAPLMLSFRFDAGELLRLIERWRGSWIVAPLTAYIALLDHPDLQMRDLSSLRKAASGGAPVSASVVTRFENSTGLYLHNAYGLTETTSAAILVPLGARAPIGDDGALSIGVPVPGAEVRIARSDDGSEAPFGVAGELLIRGPMVVPGYWHNDTESKKAIRDGWLHTGDVATRDEAGWYWIVDRLKDVIISSGFKVWPREVEDVLYQHPAVAEASVVGVPDPFRGERVEAFVVLTRAYESSAVNLAAHCAEVLSNYKVPRAIHIVTQLPKTATGKILRRELRARASELARDETANP